MFDAPSPTPRMASVQRSTALIKRPVDDVALMPPPPVKRIKRPPKVLDEDEYTSALSDIIARDYFPGLLESQAQQEYLSALESNDDAWIAEAGQKLRAIMNPLHAGRRPSSGRNTRFDTPSATPRPAAEATPFGNTGAETPTRAAEQDDLRNGKRNGEFDTSKLSLSAFQAKYTSEDNESFNTLLDKQNEKRRGKHAHLWTQDQRIPSARQIEHRVREVRLLRQREEDDASGKALIPMTTGATDARPAKPDAWKIKKPDNTFMFHASSIDEEGLETVQDVREAASKAGPRQVIHSNTRFPSLHFVDDPGPVPPSPSLNTDIITRREAAEPARSETEFTGGETPRVNGYAFVEEDEPENISTGTERRGNGPSYRDLLAGQVADGTPNPFKISENRKREDLHHRLVEKQAKKRRMKEDETVRTPMTAGTPVVMKTSAGGAGNMTPAARKLMEKLGRTPVGTAKSSTDDRASTHLWITGRTPRRKAAGNC